MEKKEAALKKRVAELEKRVAELEKAAQAVQPDEIVSIVIEKIIASLQVF